MKYLFSLLILTFFPALALAVDVTTFQNIPFLSGEASSGAYTNALYQTSIAIAAILVVIRLIWAGTEYMLSDLVTSKEAAKSKIKNALIGLLIILGAVTILNTINPNLSNLNVVGKGGSVKVSDQDVIDRIQMKVGGRVTANGLKVYCGAGFFSGVDQDCYNKAVAAYGASCAHNGGKLEYTPWTLWAITGSTAWTCKGP